MRTPEGKIGMGGMPKEESMQSELALWKSGKDVPYLEVQCLVSDDTEPKI